MEIERQAYQVIKENIRPQRVLLLLGARRTGKTFLLKKLLRNSTEPALTLNGETADVWEMFSRRTVNNFLSLLNGATVLIIDEAQKIPGIGESLKLMVDEIPGLKIIVSGSSSFDISNKTGEPLTGRKNTIRLFPLSETEYLQTETMTEKRENLRMRMVFGNYPELLSCDTPKQKTHYLKELIDSYLLKDILAFEGIRNSAKVLQLLRLIAFQIGSEVSLNELGRQLQLSKNTVEKYLDLLEKSFVIHRVGGYSSNLRREITRHSKWYFFDNGIRNILINNVNPVEARDDVGQLWENYIISERTKQQHYGELLVSNYFWRTYDGQEIDWVEQRGGRLHAYEFKWNHRAVRIPALWSKSYPDSTFNVISSENYFEWLKDYE